MAGLERMTDEQLQAENEKLMKQRDDIRAKQLAVNQELGRRADLAKVEDLVAGMDPERRDAFVKGVTATVKSAAKEGAVS